MPFLHKKSFVRKLSPPGITTNDKVFYCELTNEAFSDYDEYWERLVLCNAMVWTCEITGRPNLTYQEATDCEAKAAKFVGSISPSLKLPLLYLASLTRRGRQADVSEDVFAHCNDRYFPGEPVEAIVNKHWYDCKVVRVIYPNKEEIALYEKEMAESDEEGETDSVGPVKDVTNMDPLKDVTMKVVMTDINKALKKQPQDGSISKPFTLDDDNTSNADSDIQIIEPAALKPPTTPQKSVVAINKDDPEYPPYATYKYEVEEELAWDYKICKRHIVSWDQIRRTKNVFSREKCRLLLKICSELSPLGFWQVKGSVTQKYKIKDLKYKDLFPGNTPRFAESKSKKMPLTLSPRGKQAHDRKQKKEGKLREKKEARVEKRQSKGAAEDANKKKGRPSLSNDEKLSRKLERLKSKEAEMNGASPTATTSAASPSEVKRIMEERQDHFAQIKEILKQKIEKEKLEKKQERDVKNLQRKLLASETKEWLRLREDLQCGDHKPLPEPVPVQCGIPNELFGDFLSLLEFINSFSEALELTDVYTHGISFEMLENALVTKEVAGVFNDVVQLLLGAVFSLQEEEEDEITADTTIDPAMGLTMDDGCDDQIAAAVSLANRASQWATQQHSTSLHQLPLDALTLTEVLRLHILSSGSGNGGNVQWRHMNRGGYKHLDDPGLQMKVEQPNVVKVLAQKSIFDFTIEMKMQVLQCLMQQILTYASTRDRLEDAFDKIREVKTTLREHQWSYKHKEREEHQARMLKKKEDRLKKLQPIGGPAAGDATTAAGDATTAAGDATTAAGDATTAADQQQPPVVTATAATEENQSEDEEEKKEKQEQEEKNRERRKQDHSKKEIELCEQILELSSKVNPISLGMDRCYRRYWVFSSVPGLFVEDDEAYPGVCLDVPTKEVLDLRPEACNTTLARLRQQAREIVNPGSIKSDIEEKANTSDKENDTNTPNKINGAFDGADLNNAASHTSVGGGDATINRVVSSPASQISLMKVLQAPPKKLLKASNSVVNGATKIIQKSPKDQSIMNFFTKSPKCVNGTTNGVKDIPEVVITSPSKIKNESTKQNIDTKTNEVQVGNAEALKVEEEEKEDEVAKEIIGLCTADLLNCPVHSGNTGRPKWSFYYKEEDINALIKGLHDRGERESALKENIILYFSKIENSLKSCPVYILNPTEDWDQEMCVRKSKRGGGKKGGDTDTNLNFPLGTSIDHILEMTLRDMILEVEEKLYVGVLGRLQVADREQWRTAVTSGNTGIDGSKLNWAGQKRITAFKSELEFHVEESNASQQFTTNSTIAMLAAALLQVSQSVDAKHLKSPLAETDKVKQKRLKAERKLKRIAEKRNKERVEQQQEKEKAAEHSDDSDSDSEAGDANTKEAKTVSDNSLRTPVERWEASLMNICSYSQIFLHLATLDNSIMWSRSLTKTRCRVCRKGGDHEKMLLCDGCDKGHHIYCLKPKIKSIPDGDWFCDKCKPKLKAKSPRKNRTIYTEEEEEDQEEQVQEQEEEQEDDEEEEEDGEADPQGYEDDFCVMCNSGGSLICCDKCPRSYHQDCVSLRKIPRGTWYCPQCSAAEQEKDTKAAKKSKASSEDKSPKSGTAKASSSKRTDNKAAAVSSKKSLAAAAAAESDSKSRKRKSAPQEIESRGSKRRAVEEVADVATNGSTGKPSKRSRTERNLDEPDEKLHPSILEKLLAELQSHNDSWPFRSPVNKKMVPDYYQVVKKPMDLQTMRAKLNGLKYSSDAEFIADGLLVFQNCQQYNMEDTDEYKSGVKLAKLFRKRATVLGLEIESDKQDVANGRPAKQAKTPKKAASAKRKRQSL